MTMTSNDFKFVLMTDYLTLQGDYRKTFHVKQPMGLKRPLNDVSRETSPTANPCFT